MLQITKIFKFEMAHAIHGYNGKCKNIHGHSYEFHVSVSGNNNVIEIPAPGFIMDFKELKSIVVENVINNADHKLMLSIKFLKENPGYLSSENLVTTKFEPSAENLLLYFYKQIENKFPTHINLVKLRLYETRDSFAEWIA